MTHFITALVAFIVTIGLLVAVHEYGHLIVARWCGVRVLRYSIGFGPKIASLTSQRSGITYQVTAIPFGGYVKMLDEREGEVTESDRDKAFNRVHPWRRIAILAAGPVVNVLFAIIAYWLVFMMGVSGVAPVVGQPPVDTPAAQAGLRAQDRVLSVNGRPVATWQSFGLRLIEHEVEGKDATLRVERPDAGKRSITLPLSGMSVAPDQLLHTLGLVPWQPPGPVQIMGVQKDSPAARAGLAAGYQVLAVDGDRVKRPRELQADIKARPGAKVTLLVTHEGTRQDLTVTLDSKPGTDGPVGYLGAYVGLSPVAARQTAVTVHYGPVAATKAAWVKVVDITRMTGHFLVGMVSGKMSTSNLAGPVQIADTAGQMAGLGVQAFIGFLGLISLSLAILNLFPIPVLDGGQIVMTAIEWVRGKALPENVYLAANGAGMAAVLLLMGLAFFNDISRVVGGG